MQVFSLNAQVLGHNQSVSATNDGSGLVLHTESAPYGVSTLRQAIRLARQDIGSFLSRGARPDHRWGLHVTAGQVQAVYGDWPLLTGAPSDRRPEPSLLRRIREDWREADGPRAALENAVRIIEAYTSPSRRAAA